jgi:hypothetical protein
MNFVVYCHIFPHIYILYNVISMFYIDLEDFLNNPLSSGFNYVWQKIPFVSVFDFQGATGHEKRARSESIVQKFEMNKMS